MGPVELCPRNWDYHSGQTQKLGPWTHGATVSWNCTKLHSRVDHLCPLYAWKMTVMNERHFESIHICLNSTLSLQREWDFFLLVPEIPWQVSTGALGEVLEKYSPHTLAVGICSFLRGRTLLPSVGSAPGNSLGGIFSGRDHGFPSSACDRSIFICYINGAGRLSPLGKSMTYWGPQQWRWPPLWLCSWYCTSLLMSTSS